MQGIKKDNNLLKLTVLENGTRLQDLILLCVGSINAQ